MRAQMHGRTTIRIALLALTIVAATAAPAPAAPVSANGGFQMPRTVPSDPGVTQPPVWSPPPAPGAVALLSADGRTAIAPASAPAPVKAAIAAANRITRTPYRWGGGHRGFASRAYDCSGAVSYALHGGGLLQSPLDSRGLMRWGVAGPGAWITVYTSRRHAFAVIAGLRFDTSGPGESGPRWRPFARSIAGFKVRHVPGL